VSDLCPAVSHSGLTCNKEDAYTDHQSLAHRNGEEEREWPICNSDRVRWGMVQEKKPKGDTKVTDVVTKEAESG
jgi:hypothetical protein